MFEVQILNENHNFNDLIKLSKDFFYEYESHNPLFFKIDKINNDDIKNYFNSFINNKDKIAYVALLKNKIIGYITIYIKEQSNYFKIKKIGNISGLMVDNNYRNKGVASQLLKYSVDYFKQKSIKYFTVFTSINNKLGIKFYNKRGMKDLYTTLIGEI